MLRYMALQWKAHDFVACEVAQQFDLRLQDSAVELSCVLRTDGLIVYANVAHSGQLYVLQGCTGLVMGTLFSRSATSNGYRGISVLNAAQSRAIIETRGKWLIENTWGSYVALLSENRGSHQLTVRDCSGKIPCYTMRYDKIALTFSDPGDLLLLPLPTHAINWRYLAAFLHCTEIQVRECGIQGMQEVLAGECVETTGESTSQYSLWSPARIFSQSSIADYEVAGERLRATVQMCIEAWASSYQSILLNLSGGFDSAVVLGCLQRCRHDGDIQCLNWFGTNPQEDERHFARLAARRAHVPLIERQHQLTPPSDSELQEFTAKPSLIHLFASKATAATQRLMEDVRAEVIWTGEGGDHLFFQSTTELLAADCFRQRGFDRNFLRTIDNAARISRKAYWSVLKGMWRESQKGLTRDAQKIQAGDFFTESSVSLGLERYAEHPWAEEIEGFPAGKQLQVRLLGELLNRSRPLRNFPCTFQHHPLLSQPLIELCIQIPIWILLHEGRPRGLARTAFSDCVPPEITQRSGKGGMSDTVVDALRSNISAIAELLMDGSLMREGLISRQGLSMFFSGRALLRGEDVDSLLACIAAELWLRSCLATINQSSSSTSSVAREIRLAS